MSSEFSREIRKLEVRLEDYVKADQEFVERVKGYAQALRKLAEGLEKREKTPSPNEIEKLSRIRRDVIRSLSQVMKSESSVEHEKSHLLESYAALVSYLENVIAKLNHDSI